MPTSVYELADEVLDLPAEDRAKILELLISSFEPQSPIQQTWTSLALRRRDEVKDGKVQMLAGREAVQRVRAQI